jgi:septal ring factor EnvC (AmiA/AmiB activator)
VTNEELERVMNFIIERQERVAEQQELFATQMTQSNERVTRLERLAEYQQGLLTGVIESQDRTNQDVRNLTTQVDRIVEAVAALIERADGANGNGRA